MATAPHSSGAARGLFLARLLVCLVLAAGVLVLLVPLCGDGMPLLTPADSPRYAVATADDTRPVVAERGSSCDGPVMAFPALWCGPTEGSATFAVGVAGAPAPSDAALLACMAVLVAILGAVLGLRRPWSSRASPPPSPVGPGAFTCLSRRPVLAELCVLRT
ncbi:MAG: hypothetical protein ABR608_04295 [Pseudonocardiaceae bacterium]